MKFLATIVLFMFLAGCGTVKFTDPKVQEALINTAVATGQVACFETIRSLKPSEQIAMKASLEAAGVILVGGEGTEVSKKIAALDPHVAPFAPLIASWVDLAKASLPDADKSVEWQIASGVVTGCLRLVPEVA